MLNTMIHLNSLRLHMINMINTIRQVNTASLNLLDIRSAFLIKLLRFVWRYLERLSHDSTLLYLGSTLLYLTLHYSTMALLHCNYSTLLYYGPTSFCLTLRYSTTALLFSTWVYISLAWLYFTVLESTLLYIGSTSLYFTPQNSTMALLHSTWLYITLDWLYFTLLHST